MAEDSNLNDKQIRAIQEALSLIHISKTMIDPIEKLTEGAERIATGDFNETLSVESTDEIGVLTTTVNDMASVLHSTDVYKRQVDCNGCGLPNGQQQRGRISEGVACLLYTSEEEPHEPRIITNAVEV